MKMKKEIIVLFLISFSFNPIFSQNNYEIKLDSSFNITSYNNNIYNIGLINNTDKKVLVSNFSSFPVDKFNLDYKIENFISTKDSLDIKLNSWNYDDMPILNPKGNYSMKIMIPDTSNQYSLLIKKP